MGDGLLRRCAPRNDSTTKLWLLVILPTSRPGFKANVIASPGVEVRSNPYFYRHCERSDEATLTCHSESTLLPPSLRGAQRRSNPLLQTTTKKKESPQATLLINILNTPTASSKRLIPEGTLERSISPAATFTCASIRGGS